MKIKTKNNMDFTIKLNQAELRILANAVVTLKMVGLNVDSMNDAIYDKYEFKSQEELDCKVTKISDKFWKKLENIDVY